MMAIQDFLGAMRSRGRADLSVAAYSVDLRQLERHLIGPNLCASVDWPAVTPAHLTVWRAELARTAAPATIARKTSAARAFCRWLGRDDLLDVLPWRLPDCEPRVPLTEAETDRLLASAANGHAGTREALVVRDVAIVAVLLGCGLRTSEMVTLDATDVGECSLRVGPWRDVPLPALARGDIEDYLIGPRGDLLAGRTGSALFVNQRGERLSRQGVHLIVAGRGEAAGLTGVSPRRLRAAYAARLFAEGLDVRDVAMLLGVAIEAAEAYRPRRPRRAA